jgi:hypothetical protein
MFLLNGILQALCASVLAYTTCLSERMESLVCEQNTNYNLNMTVVVLTGNDTWNDTGFHQRNCRLQTDWELPKVGDV